MNHIHMKIKKLAYSGQSLHKKQLLDMTLRPLHFKALELCTECTFSSQNAENLDVSEFREQ